MAPDVTRGSPSSLHYFPPCIMADSRALLSSNTHSWGQGSNRRLGRNCWSHSRAISWRIFANPSMFCQPEACFSVQRLLPLSVRGWERAESLSMVLQKTQLSENPTCAVLQLPNTYSFKIYLVYEYVKFHKNLWWTVNHSLLFLKRRRNINNI